MNRNARLYLEAHITVEAQDLSQWEAFKQAVPGFKVSRFDEDEVDGYDGKWFASARGTQRFALGKDILAALSRLEHAGFKALRWKVEDTLVDSKYGDTEDALRRL